MKTIHIFISHSWKHPYEYNELIQALNDARVDFKDYSTPKDDPIENVPNYDYLWLKLYEKIKNCNCFIFFSGLSSTYSSWIEEELGMALALNKPIICIDPRGQERHTQLKELADVTVGWDKPCIIRTIKDCVRN